MFLTRADFLTDKYEVNLPISNSSEIKDYLSNRINDSRIVKKKLQSINSTIEKTKLSSYLSSWSLDTEESYALWKIYLDNSKLGVAISTTATKLENSIISTNYNFVDKLFLKKVEYTNHIKYEQLLDNEFNIKDIDQIICSKSTFYRYENEARLYTRIDNKTNNSKVKKGIYLKIKPNILIDEIILSPFIREWALDSFGELVKKLLPDKNLEISKSDILEK